MAEASNTAAIEFPPPTSDWDDPTHVGLFATSDGTVFLGSSALTDDVDAPTTGAAVSFAANALEIEVPDGELASQGSNRAVNGIINGTVYVSLHSASPGSTGTNELSGNGYARVAIASSAWTVS